MPIEENRAVARRVLDDLVSQGRFEVIGQIYAQAFEFREPTAGLTISTYEASGMLTRDIRMRTPDITIVIEEEIAEGDAVVLVSEYVVFDRLGMLRQLGLAPTPGQPPA